MTRVAWVWLIVVATVRLLVASSGAAQCCGSEQCAGDLNCDGQVSINEIITTINNALFGCGASVSADQACTDLALATCTKVDDCVLNGTTQRYGGATTCRTRQKDVCLAPLAANGTGNNPTAGTGLHPAGDRIRPPAIDAEQSTMAGRDSVLTMLPRL